MRLSICDDFNAASHLFGEVCGFQFDSTVVFKNKHIDVKIVNPILRYKLCFLQINVFFLAKRLPRVTNP